MKALKNRIIKTAGDSLRLYPLPPTQAKHISNK